MKPLSESIRKIKTLLSVLDRERYTHISPVENIKFKKCDYKGTGPLPDYSAFDCYTPGTVWSDKMDEHAWFCFDVDAPETVGEGELIVKIRTDETDWDAVNPQFIVYVDGKITQGLDTNHMMVRLSGKKSYKMHIYAYAGMHYKINVRFFADIMVEHPDITKLYYDLLIPYQVLDYADENSKEYHEIVTRLNSALTKVNFLKPGSREFYDSIKDAQKYLDAELYDGLCKDNGVTIISIGHTHIDVAWLWTLEQTREKVQRSFSTVVNLMKRYPEYKFMSSQAVLYKMLKEDCPELYAEIKELIKAGRWEVEGAMWVEADCNLSSGESLVRQVQYGKEFFKKEFDVDSHVLWLPDVFGYSAALPQILRKSGVDWFVTSKIGWNDTNTMPYDTFIWRGIDGTEINSHFLTAQPQKKGLGFERYSSYGPMATAQETNGAWNRYQQKELTNEAIMTFGYGDGGGGPTEEMLESLRRTKKGIPGCAKTEIKFAGQFLDKIAKNIKKHPEMVPYWQGELYLEFHRGTYTSIARNKKNNRMCEFLTLDAEANGVLMNKLAGKPFPKNELHSVWETLLTNQFHDIIPGSSIPEVYERSDRDYAEIRNTTEGIIGDSHKYVATKVSDEGYVVFNPHSFKNSSTVKIDGRSVYVKDIPSKGYKVIKPEFTDTGVKISGRTVSTRFFTVRLDKDYNITSIYDKKNHREVIKNGKKANQLIVLEDYNDCYPTWELQHSSRDKVYNIDTVSDIYEINDGARQGIHITRHHQESTIDQIIWFYADMPKIDFETKVDWHQIKQLLKVSFPVEINSDKASYEIQFGTIERPTHFNTTWDQAKFEVCGHKYADLSEGNYGVSLINDCKYGHDIHEGDMRLTLIKCDWNPGNTGVYNDQGEHSFTYSVYPHAGNLANCDVVKYAYDLNMPMTAIKAQGDGSLADEYSLVSVDRENVIIETVKQAENDEKILIRMYETKNTRTRATVKFGFDITEAYLCDLSENEQKKLTVKNNSVSIDIKPFEIVTIIVG
ncbi:MAG: alpha-mannosidase [Clostridia bacterium]|nr:alpha-mannosidase [Clostridia bacterium]